MLSQASWKQANGTSYLTSFPAIYHGFCFPLLRKTYRKLVCSNGLASSVVVEQGFCSETKLRIGGL